ncbi:hypothetical protein EDD16DRAFT_704885 [Pisolithus croceorrhizus]|nr:hypothetical protein EDD16DRAFT_704885 [Pisolithus croceorrhizus]KAI6165995.1 hypothetical protein EDD17DRAFT_114816 [Pisolithus thermaeus]
MVKGAVGDFLFRVCDECDEGLSERGIDIDPTSTRSVKSGAESSKNHTPCACLTMTGSASCNVSRMSVRRKNATYFCYRTIPSWRCMDTDDGLITHGFTPRWHPCLQYIMSSLSTEELQVLYDDLWQIRLVNYITRHQQTDKTLSKLLWHYSGLLGLFVLS